MTKAASPCSSLTLSILYLLSWSSDFSLTLNGEKKREIERERGGGGREGGRERE